MRKKLNFRKTYGIAWNCVSTKSCKIIKFEKCCKMSRHFFILPRMGLAGDNGKEGQHYKRLHHHVGFYDAQRFWTGSTAFRPSSSASSLLSISYAESARNCSPYAIRTFSFCSNSEVLSFIACSPADETANYVEKCPNLRSPLWLAARQENWHVRVESFVFGR